MLRVNRVRKAGIDIPRPLWAAEVRDLEAPRALPAGVRLGGVLVVPGGLELWGTYERRDAR